MFIILTDSKTDIQLLVNMMLVERIEKRSRGSALYYPARRRPVRVRETARMISKLLRAR